MVRSVPESILLRRIDKSGLHDRLSLAVTEFTDFTDFTAAPLDSELLPRGANGAICEICVIGDPQALPSRRPIWRFDTELALPWFENLSDAMIRAREMELRLAITRPRNRAPHLGLQRHQLTTQLRFSVF